MGEETAKPPDPRTGPAKSMKLNEKSKVAMQKRILTVISLLLAAVLLVSCDAPGVVVLDELLPALTEKTTGYTVTRSIVVTRISTDESVEFSTPVEMETFHQRLEGIKCIKDKKTDGLLARYAITFFTADTAETLFVVSETDFIFEDVHYEAMRAGIDMVYLDSLFPSIEVPDYASAEEPQG